ncbi:ECF-type sigma factor [Gemmata sp.]|uniref:ECF-type sigma factor n=1 Tax=Gemmata sp. TaxID=1914242 RepID=UPI003F7104EC
MSTDPSPEARPPAAQDASRGSVTRWIAGVRAGDSSAALRLWQRYFHSLTTLARRRLHGTPTAVADEEDVALSAFRSFCRGAGAGKFPRLAGRADLWPLLAAITSNKACDQAAWTGRLKRGGAAPAADADLSTVPSPEPGPDALAETADVLRDLLDRLGDPALRAVAELRLEGHSVEEVASRLGCVPRTIERKLNLIRQVWTGGEG